MLHIAEVEHLLLHFLLCGRKLFRLLVKLTLDLVDTGIKRGDRVFEVLDLLVLVEELTLVGLDIIHQNGFIALLCLHFF